MTDKVTITTPVCSVRFPHLTEHEKYDGITTGKYSLTMVFDPEVAGEVADAITKAGGGRGRSPLKEIPADAQYDAGKFIMKAKSGYEVKAFNISGSPISLSDVTPNSVVRVKVSFAPYSQQGGGVTAYLGNIQLLEAGATGDADFGDLPAGYTLPSDEELDNNIPF